MELIIFVGIAGSGKTTFAAKSYPNHVRISLDDIGQHKKNKRKIEETLIKQALATDKNVIIDDTNLTKSIRSKHIMLGKKHGAEIKVIFFNFDIYRIQLQNKRDEQPLEPYVLFKMKKNLEIPSKEEGFDFIQILDKTISF